MPRETGPERAAPPSEQRHPSRGQGDERQNTGERHPAILITNGERAKRRWRKARDRPGPTSFGGAGCSLGARIPRIRGRGAPRARRRPPARVVPRPAAGDGCPGGRGRVPGPRRAARRRRAAAVPPRRVGVPRPDVLGRRARAHPPRRDGRRSSRGRAGAPRPRPAPSSTSGRAAASSPSRSRSSGRRATSSRLDRSPAALSLAAANARRHGVAAASAFSRPTGSTRSGPRPASTSSSRTRRTSRWKDAPHLSKTVSDYEPALALYGGDGRPRPAAHAPRDAARRSSSAGAPFVFEFGYGQANDVSALVEASGAFRLERVRLDAAGIPRHGDRPSGAARLARPMDAFLLRGPVRLAGTVAASGAKNAALPALAAALLRGAASRSTASPTSRTSGRCGAPRAAWASRSRARRPGACPLRADRVTSTEAPYDLVRTMRASILVLGPLLARFGEARVSLPGGCAIGVRPVDLHLMRARGDGGARSPSRRGTSTRTSRASPRRAGASRGRRSRFPLPTVTGTENVLFAAALARGTTVIENAALEPEVEDAARAPRRGWGRGSRARGRRRSRWTASSARRHRRDAARRRPGPHRGRDVPRRRRDHGRRRDGHERPPRRPRGVPRRPPARGRRGRGRGGRRPRPADRPAPRDGHHDGAAPGLPDRPAGAVPGAHDAGRRGRRGSSRRSSRTASSTSAELLRLGADVQLEGRTAVVRGPTPLEGAPVTASDLRASAALVLGGPRREGRDARPADLPPRPGLRGMDVKLRSARGAAVERIPTDNPPVASETAVRPHVPLLPDRPATRFPRRRSRSRTTTSYAFHDVAPKAPTHVLVVPEGARREALRGVAGRRAELARLLVAVARIAGRSGRATTASS